MLKRKGKNEKDVLYILDSLRAADLEEVKAIHGTKWKQRVFTDIMKTEFDVLIGVSDNIPVCMGGAWNLDKDEDDFAVVWMLSTDEVINHKISLLKKLKEIFCEYDKKYKYFYNFIYSINRDAKKWLKWLGFKFDKPRPLGLDIPEGFEFFYRVKG